MTATYMYQQQMQQQQRQKQQDQQRNRPRSSPAASGLYPVVQDLSDVEYDNACCCGETFGSFRLADLVMPATVPSPSIWQQSSQKPPAKPSEQQRKHHQHQDEQQEQQSQEKVEVQASFEKDAHSEEQEPLQEDTTERREGSELHVSILPSSSGGLGGPTKSQSLHVQSSSGRDREEASSKLIRPHSVHRTKSGACLYEPESPTHSSSKRARRLSDAPSFYSNEDDEDDETQNKQSTPRQKDNWTKTGTPLSGKKLHLRRRSRQLMNRLLLTRNPSTATDNDDNKDLSTSETKDLTSMNDALWDVSFVFEGSYRTFKEHYVVIRQLFKTRYAILWECIQKETGERVCAKIFDEPAESANQVDSSVQSELDMLYTLNKEHGGHPSLIHLVEVLVDQSKLHAIMEWIPGGNLASIIVQNGTFAEERVQRLIFSLLQGVEFLHSHHVVHTNLQPENILLASTRQVKIVDFGSAVDLEVYEPFGSRGTNVSFTAPEVLLGKESYDTQADMWSVGCLAYYMLSGSSPFDNDSRRKAIQRIIRAEYSFPSEMFPPNASRTAKQFISNLIHADPSVRLTASEALNHPWLQKAKMEDQQELKSSQHHGLFGRSSHHKQHHSMDANIMGHLNIMPNSTHPQQNGHHSRHQSLSPCPSARNGNKSKSHRRKTSFGSLSKGISKLFSCKDESIKSATVASSSSAASVADTTASEIAVHMGSSRTLNSGDDSWSGGVSIPSLVNSNTWGGSSGNTRKVNNRMSHRRQLTK